MNRDKIWNYIVKYRFELRFIGTVIVACICWLILKMVHLLK